MKFAAVSFVSSSRMASFRSCANRRRRCLTSFAPSLTFRQCSITSRETPGISEGFQAKMSWFCLKEDDERVFLFVVEACPDQSHLCRIGRVERDLLDILVGTDPSLGRSCEPDGVPVG